MSTGSLKVYMARVFSAVDIEDEKLLDRLEEVRETLDIGFNPVKREKLHVTLEFFEDVEKENINEIKKAMDVVELDSFEADVKRIGVFPSEEHIRVVWAGVDSEKFQELYKQVSDHSVSSDNNHDFQPHITLMRVRNPSREQKKKLKRTIREFSDHEFGKIKVDEVKLFESYIDGKTKYKQLHKKEL
jgi:2'-5' RNA ligase